MAADSELSLHVCTRVQGRATYDPLDLWQYCTALTLGRCRSQDRQTQWSVMLALIVETLSP